MNEVKALLLAAGLGTRLYPLTNACPKCLVPILGRPLLEYWLCNLSRCEVPEVWVNVHHHRETVIEFLSRGIFHGWVNAIIEDNLRGTAGTLRDNAAIFGHGTTLLAHADNWCHCDFKAFLDFHFNRRPAEAVITMMTFRTKTPRSCGIVEVDDAGLVCGFYEKNDDPPGNYANGAVYLLEPEVVEWVVVNPGVTDFSTQVIPYFLGRIATWENTGVHRDIGVVDSLIDAQSDPPAFNCWPSANDDWHIKYQKHAIHNLLATCTRSK